MLGYEFGGLIVLVYLLFNVVCYRFAAWLLWFVVVCWLIWACLLFGLVCCMDFCWCLGL